MPDLQYWQEKIKERRKTTSWKDFLLTIGSWRPMAFYKNNGHISKYPESERIQNIVSIQDHAAQRDSMTQYAMDWTGDLFADLAQLFRTVPIAAVNHFGENENCDYSDVAYNAKNIYLSIVTTRGVENAAYVFNCKDNSTNVFSSINVLEWSENVYASNYIIQSYNVFFSENIINSSNIRLSTNCIGCTECVDCDGLENVSYCIQNTKLDKDAYFLRKQEILQNKEKLIKKISDKPLNMGSFNVQWTNLYNCHDVTNAYSCINVKNARNVALISSNEDNGDFYDVFMGGRSTNFYGVCDAGGFSDNCYCITQCATCASMYYSMFCEWCSFCLGCIGLKNKQFCILNKQYSKEERLQKVDEIFARMEQEGILGQFFPWSMNPFYFNDTASYLIDQSFTKEQVTQLWYLRRNEPVKVDIPVSAEVVKVNNLGEFESFDTHGNRQIDPTILKKIVVDEQWNHYRIVKMEYDFLLKYWLPLPRKHRLDRMKENFRLG